MVLAAATALIIIGTLEAAASADQLAETVGKLRPEGAGFTAVSLLLSAAVYVAVGWLARADDEAVRVGAVVGVIAGGIGGGLRAWLIRDGVRDAVERYAVVPDWFVPVVLAAFALLALIASAAGGCALAFVGRRWARAARPRPRA